MSKAVFPTENEVGLVFGKSPRILMERQLATWQRYLSTCSLENFVYQGLTLSAGSGLSVNVAPGDAIIRGYWASNDATENLAALAADRTIEAPNFIFAQLTRGVDSRVVLPGYNLVANTSGTPPVDSVLLGFASTNATAVTGVISSRAKPALVGGTYTGNGDFDETVTQTIHLGFQPKRVWVHGRLDFQTTPTTTNGFTVSIPPGGTQGFSSFAGLTSDLTHIPELLTYGFRVKSVGTLTSATGPNSLSLAYNYFAEA